jgi:sec-independent protein translocase protein TatB
VFNVGTPELLVILLVALLVLGPNKLPDAARQVGRFIGEMRRMSTGFQTELRDAMQEPVSSTSTTPRRSDPVPKATPAADIKPVSQVIPDESYAADPSSASPGVPEAGDADGDPPTGGGGTGSVAHPGADAAGSAGTADVHADGDGDLAPGERPDVVLEGDRADDDLR